MNLDIRNGTQAQLETGALDLASHKLEALGGDGELALYRAHPAESSKSSLSMLVVVPLTQPSPAALRRMRHEYALRDQLDGASAVRPLALAQLEGRSALVLEDPGGMPLDRLLSGPMQIARFLRLAAAIAVALGQLHKRGLVHKDVKPANILVDAADDRVWLMGLGLASRLPRERQSPAPPELIAGTLAYVAPEQTGRMNRSIDSRSDLYALGVTLYEMLTGSLPFTAADPMEWVHCHIAREAVPPHERCADVPPAVSAIVMKLLAKTPEERYQTAGGVERDLRRCLASWEAHGQIDAFALGEQDTPDRLVIPERLYGRSNEVAALLAAFERTVSSSRPELVLVSGYSGIGKSSVVNELHRALVPARGLFASGKFDQYQRDIPYATLAQAFQRLVRPLLAKSEAELAGWREALQQALGSNARLVVDLVPEVKLVIGEPAPLNDLPPQDAQRRFQLVLRRFIGVFARAEHPLALFLDDLQWLDAATLDLIEDLMTQSDVGHLLLIGAYRDNEVGAFHPLLRKLDAIRQAQAAVQEISLGPLARDDVAQLIADALRCERERAAPLAQLVHERTGGNPFFVIQFLFALVENGPLFYDHVSGRWSWDLERIHAQGYTDNVVELIVGRLARLGAPTQEALRQLACLGSNAELTRLSLILGTSEDELHAQLSDAVAAELIERQDSAYRFIHDRVREAAYSLIPEEARAAAHLRIGRLLAAHTPADKREESIFEIVGQLNRGAELIISPEEREQLAELNLLAGKRAKASAAYASALTYLAAGAHLLSEDAWERRHELVFALELHRAHCEFLTGSMAEAEQRLAVLAGRAANLPDLATVARSRMELFTTLGEIDRTIEVCLDYLQHVGVRWAAHPTEEEVRDEYERISQQLVDRPLESLLDLPRMVDPVACGTMDVLTALLSAARCTDENLRWLSVGRMVNLSLVHGNSDPSCVAYALLGLAPQIGDYRPGCRFGQLGLELMERRGLDRYKARVYMNFAIHVQVWTGHVKASRPLLQRAFDAALQVGDLNTAVYCRQNLVANLLAGGDPLAQVQQEAEASLDFARQMRYGIVVDNITTQLQLIRTLRGGTAVFGRFDDAHLDEARFERHLQEDARLAIAACLYWIRKLQARFFAGDYAASIQAASQAQPLLWTLASFFELAEYHFYVALARAALCDAAAYRPGDLDALAGHHRQLEEWAGNCAEAFGDRVALVGAELARADGRDADAMRLYEDAVRSARANGYVHHEALAYETAARFYRSRGCEEIADLYLRNARRCYVSWGADGKVRQLDARHPHLRAEEPPSSTAGTIAAPVEHLDLATVLKVSQAVSGEIVLDKLIDKLMRTALEHAGAQRGLLIDSREGVLHLEAQAVTSGNDFIVHRTGDPIETVGLSRSIVNYVSRTHEVAIFDTAERESPFYDDEYVRATHVRSILCLPLIRQGQAVALLYLENNLAPGVFTPARVAVLKLLASEAATSLENSRLYRELQEREGKVRRLVDSNIIGVVIADLDGAILEANEAFLSMLGYSQEDLAAGRLRWADITPVEWLAANQRAWEQTRVVGRCEAFEKEYFRKDGSRVRALVGGAAFDEARTKAISFVLDLTERKRAEDERRAHLWFLESMDRINRAIQGTSDLERMMSEVLDAVLEVFACDRAWLVYPCDPHAPSWRVVMEHARPEYPGAFALQTALPVDTEVAAVFAAARAASGAVQFQPHSDLKVPAQVSERFAIRSQIVMAVHPKGDQTYMFGLHQCSYERVWTAQEERLFQEIGRRLADALSSLIAFRSLRESERRLEEAQRIAHVGYWERDLDSGYTTVSAEACRIFGLHLDEGQTSLTQQHERLRELVHPEDRPRTAQAAAIAQNGGPRYDLEYRLVRPDGDVRIVHSRGEVTRDESGRPRHLFGMMQDITELRQTERRLEEAQRMARVGWWERDLVAGRVAFSDQVWEFYGIPVQDRVADLAEWKRRLPALIHEDDREKVLGAYEVSIAGGHRVEVIYRAVRPDGTMRVGRGWGDTMLDEAGRPLRQFGVVQDITELWQAEQELRASEARFRTFVDHATDAFFLQDDQSKVIDVNWQACESLGYSREELITMRPRDIDAALDEAALERLAEQARRGETVTFDTLHRRKDGSVFPVEIRTHQFQQGEQRFYLSLARDISERKRAEEEHRAHVWFLESMDRINRAMQGSADLERMMRDVLEVLLDVFACDRAWLIYPCDPQSPSWRTVMERTRPQFPGALALNDDLPTDTEKAAVFASALASSAPVLLVPGTVAKRLAIRSQIATAVYPKVDQPYLFGLHQCSYERIWTEPEQRLFQEVGARLADALTSLLMFRSLQQSERKLEAAQRIARVGWWERDFRTNRVSLSEEVRRTFGVEPLDLPHWHERWVNLIHPEDRPKVAAAAAAALDDGPPYDVEYRVVRPDGSIRVVHSQGEVIRDESGRPVRQFGMLQDITALRQAEHEVRASEERFRTLVQFSFDGYWETDAQHRFTRQEYMEGLADAPKPGSETGKTRWELPYLEPDEEAWRKYRATLDAHLPFRDFEIARPAPDNRKRYVSVSGLPMFDETGRFIGYRGVGRDISERKRAEQKLRASEERFRTLVQFSFDVYWETDAQHRFTRQEFIEGLADAPEPGSEIGKTRWEVPYLEPDEEAWRKHRATLDAHLPFRDFEIARPAADGGKRYVSASGLPVFDETGRFIGYRGVGRHITERKRAEQELQRLHLHLVHMSRVMTTAELATSIAHEVNQPLGSILASVGPCLRWLNALPPDLASARGALERIANDAERASRVISRIRALVRREPPRHERINVNQVISEVIALTRDQMHSHDVALQSELAADLLVVHGDRVQLQQVILNLIANAVEAMSTIHDRRRQLTILSANDGGGVRVEVRDCGPGVDPDGAERIFEPFYTTKADGIGMGLWICRSIIEAHGGRLRVTPNPPRGAAFQFSLPGGNLKAERAARQGRQRRRSSRSEGRADQ